MTVPTISLFPQVACVAIESGLQPIYDYLIPVELQGKLLKGHQVEIPLRKGFEIGLVVDLKTTSDCFDKLRPIARILEELPPVSSELLKLADWISHYYACPLGRVLRVMVPKAIREPKKSVSPLFVTRRQSLSTLAQASATLRQKHAAQSKVLDVMLKVRTGMLLSELIESAAVSPSPVHSLVKAGYLTIEPLPDGIDLSIHRYFPAKRKLLNHDQQTSLEVIQNSLRTKDGKVHLLFGVTGSGKTEIYLQAIEELLKGEGSCLLMVPEVALTPQTIDRIRARFDCPIAMLHYQVSPGKRQKEWQAIASGKARIIVGARSSVFCPAPDLRLIIVDEEHETSYKSEESPHYHARDVAIMRGKNLQATVILGSATPSLESYAKAIHGEYQLLKLSSRAAEAHLPKVELINMLEDREKVGPALFSQTLIEELKGAVERGEQAMLFLNRRGYFTHVQCSGCGDSLMCPHCDVNLTYHRSETKLICHLCHYHCPVPSSCPKCKLPGSMKFRGWGTEHVEATLHHLIPGVRSVRIDADTTRHKGSMEQLLREFRTHKADVLIGTQMIAKGHHFPGLTLVGVLNPDAQLLQPDFRASEHLFHLLVQVFGRSGRSHLPGKVLVQTSQSTCPIYRLAAEHNFVAFAEQELQVRKLFSYPPFIHLIKVSLQAPSESEVMQLATALHRDLTRHLPKNCLISSPGEGAWRKVQDRWRQVILIKTQDPLRLQDILEACRERHQTRDLSIHYDVDCQNIG